MNSCWAWVLCLASVVVRATDLHDLHARVDQVDHRFEARMVQRVGQQAFGRVIGGDHQQDAPTEQRLEQPRNEHRIADVVDVKFVETQHPAVAQQLIEGGRQGIGLIAMTEHALMQLRKELMEVQTLFFRDRQGLEKTVEQPALAAPHSAMQVQPGKGFRRVTEQRRGVLRHAVDHALLAVAEGVALGMRLVAKVVMDDATGRGAGAQAMPCQTSGAAQASVV